MPQQIILRWVPAVMESVFSTLRPATLPLRQNHTKCLSSGVEEEKKKQHWLSPFFLHVLPFSFPLWFLSSSSPFYWFTFAVPLFLLPFVLSSGFQIKETPVWLLRLTLFVAELDVYKR